MQDSPNVQDQVPSIVEEAAPAEAVFDTNIREWLPEGLQPSWDFMSDWPIVLLPVLVIIGYLFGKGLQALLTRSVSRLTRLTSSRLDDALISSINRPILPTTVILSMLIGLGTLDLPDSFQAATNRLLLTILLFVWARAAMQVAHLVLELLSRLRGKFDLIQPRTMPVFDMTLKILVVGAAAYILMLIWGINPTAWLASAGVIGIAVGFAAKDTLSNLFSGIFIVADAPYKIGDYIVLDSGERGAVTHLGMRSTRLLTRDDVEVTIPNAVIANAKIINESGGPWEKERIRIPVGVAYGSDVDEVCSLLKEIALEHEEIMKEPAPRVRLRTFGPSSVDFELMGWIDHPELRGRIRHELHMNIYKRFMAEGIRIPFPQQDVHVRSMPEQ